MILSYHPCYEADVNIICAGRQPDEKDRAAMRRAEAVILPQGCREALYRMARNNAPHRFPNYDARFRYPGKTGQARRFRQLAVPHPRTWIFEDTIHFRRCGKTATEAGFPLVFKLDWGGQGDTVFLLKDESDLEQALSTAAAYERSGQHGFVLQAWVPDSDRTLRVVVIGQRRTVYWRVQENPFVFGTSLVKGAKIEARVNPHRRRAALALVDDFCRRTGIDLAGFDLIFADAGPGQQEPRPLFLEINYFFGRRGLGGSEHFYGMLRVEIDRWLAGLGLAVERPATDPAAEEGI